MRGLYAIADVTTLAARGVDVVAFVRAVVKARPAAIQLRAKELEARATLALLRELVPVCEGARVPLVANDRADIAAAARCDLVHVGQDDLGVEDVRRFAPGLGVGVSTHDLGQLERAIALRPDYVAYGPVFPTASKARPDPTVGVEGLRAAHSIARAARVPLVAIGGVTLERAREIAGTTDAVAVIAALLPALRAPVDLVEVTARAERFQAVLAEGGAGRG